MAEKNILGRIQHKHDVEENWLKATNFCPKEGELIIYDPDSAHTYPRMKVGNGTDNVNALPFVEPEITLDEIDAICGTVMTTGEEAQL